MPFYFKFKSTAFDF